jgi:hypothetical protein
MADMSARFGLPFIQAGQAQKEIFHNEALALIDAALHPVAQSAGDNDPPSSPVAGQCWIVGASPTGAWAGQASAIAGWTEGGWRFVAPKPGMLVWVIAEGLWARKVGSGWLIGDIAAASISVAGEQVVGPQQPAIGDPAGGATIDVEARAAIAALLAAARSHGLIAT